MTDKVSKDKCTKRCFIVDNKKTLSLALLDLAVDLIFALERGISYIARHIKGWMR